MISPHGKREISVGLIVLAILAAGLVWVWAPAALLVVPLMVWLVLFFRDPQRAITSDPYAVVSPADGMVSDVIEIANDPDLKGPAVRVGIFLSVFNVHVNRCPFDAVVLDVRYSKGKFLSALRHADASEQNESNTIVLGDPTTRQPTMVVKQITGAIARRIICTAKVGDQLKRGDRIGLIKFGSRTELTIARSLAPSIEVRQKQKVRGNLTTIARLGAPANAIA